MRQLNIVMYHYVRDLPRTRFPRIRGMLTDDFRAQVDVLQSSFEMATLESALSFLAGKYHPRRNLCLLTFDDALREHFTGVMPILAERRIQGIFGIITGCVEEHAVAPVHMNHFLAADLAFHRYSRIFAAAWRLAYGELLSSIPVDVENARRSYPLDTASEAVFKWLINFQLPERQRDEIIRFLFARYFGEECAFARELYMSWDEIRQLQSAGMLLAGHTHRHRPLSALSLTELRHDLETSHHLLLNRTSHQALWPFSYPYGKRNSYSPDAIELLRSTGYDCALTTESGRNVPGVSSFELFRTDCNGAVQRLLVQSAVA